MTQIASYYAAVGVGIDRSSLQSVQTYLDTIQKKMERFQKNAFANSTLSLRINNFSINQANLRKALSAAASNQSVRLDNVTVGKIKVSGAAMARQINSALSTTAGGNQRAYNLGVKIRDFQVSPQTITRAINRALSTTTANTDMAIRLRNFHVSQKALVAAINKALNVDGRVSRIRVGALLSQGSLSAMRSQIRESINQLVVNPTINPRISQLAVRQARSSSPSGGGGSRDRLTTRDPRSTNPWHNPMMIGGATGAFLRYGMFSLPFVAGAYGLNSLSKNMMRLEGQDIMLTTSAQGGAAAKEQFDIVQAIGQRLGLKTSDMLPFYSQMFAGARGTDLERTLPFNFANFMDYAMAMGVNDQQLEGGIRAISQAIAKGAIYSEEWRQQ